MPTSVEVIDASKTTLAEMSGSNLIYIATADSVQPTFFFTGATVSKANPGVVTFTAHGLNTDNPVTISGATAGWATINGTWIVTRLTPDTFSIPLDTTGFTGSFNGTISTTAPRTSANIWRITKNYYDGSGNLARSSYACGGASGAIYDNRASISYS